MEEINDTYIINYFFPGNHKRMNKHKLNDIPNNILVYLNNRYNDSTCLEETIHRIKDNINVHPICICGKPVKYVGKPKMFLQTCGCIECSKKINNIHGKQTTLLKYGVDNVAKSNEVKEKTKETNIKRYGYSSPLLNNEIKEKTKQTNIEKYGVEIAQQSDIVKTKMSKSNDDFWKSINKDEYIIEHINKIKNTCIHRYGVDNVMKVKQIQEQLKKFSLEKYGYEYPQQSPEIKRKIIDGLIKHNINKFNVKYPLQNDVLKQKMKDTYEHTFKYLYNVSNPMYVGEFVDKINITKRINNSYNKSNEEDVSYKLLIYKYPDVIRQYRSNVYPFSCDFYIPSIDTYIECNYHWTHGKHPFNEHNIDDINTLNNWKSHNSKFYNNAVITWTVRDVNKRNIAKQNNLNFIEFWNTDELIKWLQVGRI